MKSVLDKYTFQVTETGRMFVATCVEFPRLSHEDSSLQAAQQGIKELVDFVIKQMTARGQALPGPSEKRQTARRKTPRRQVERRITTVEAEPKRTSSVRRLKKNRRYYAQRETDMSPHSSVDIEQVPSKHLVAGSNPAGGAKKHPVVCCEWTESERGWGQRPDGISLHVDGAASKRYVEEYWSSMPKEVPDEYSRPETPMVIDVDDATYQRVVASKNGIRLSQIDARELLRK